MIPHADLQLPQVMSPCESTAFNSIDKKVACDSSPGRRVSFPSVSALRLLGLPAGWRRSSGRFYVLGLDELLFLKTHGGFLVFLCRQIFGSHGIKAADIADTGNMNRRSSNAPDVAPIVVNAHELRMIRRMKLF